MHSLRNHIAVVHVTPLFKHTQRTNSRVVPIFSGYAECYVKRHRLLCLYALGFTMTNDTTKCLTNCRILSPLAPFICRHSSHTNLSIWVPRHGPCAYSERMDIKKIMRKHLDDRCSRSLLTTHTKETNHNRRCQHTQLNT